MSITFLKGSGGARLIRAGEVTIDKYGLATGTAVWWAWNLSSVRNATSLGAGHPYASGLTCERVSVRDSDSGATLEASYAGIMGSPPDPIDELDTTVMEAPIESHPKFLEFIGTHLVPKNGALFEMAGNTMVFTQFGPDAPPEWRGVTSFEIPTSISRRTYTSTSPASAAGVGKPGNPFNSFGVSGEWLLIGVSSQKRGRVYVNRMEWKAAGKLGINKSIYN